MLNLDLIKKTFAIELNDRIREEGTTCKQAALDLRISKSAFLSYAAGKCFPSIYPLVKIAIYLNCTVDDLLGYITDPNTHLNDRVDVDFYNEDEFKDYFRDRLITMMDRARMSIDGLAYNSKVSAKTIEMYLSVHRWVPQVPDLIRICDALDCTPSDLLGY